MSEAHPRPTSESNRRLAAEFFEHFGAGDVDGAVAMMSDDVQWWIAGKPEALATAGVHDKEFMVRLFRRMLRQLTGGLQFTVLGTVAEGDKVAIELVSRGTFADGRVYNNEYHTLLTFRGGKIVAVREYLDTAHVLAIWFPPEPAPEAR
jgi:ketosteroid isomerase-like protein